MFYRDYSTRCPSTVGGQEVPGTWLLNGWDRVALASPEGLSREHQELTVHPQLASVTFRGRCSSWVNVFTTGFNVAWKYRVYSHPFGQVGTYRASYWGFQEARRMKGAAGFCVPLGWRGLFSVLSLSSCFLGVLLGHLERLFPNQGDHFQLHIGSASWFSRRL